MRLERNEPGEHRQGVGAVILPSRLPFGVSTVLHVLKNFHSLLHILDSLLGVQASLFLGPQTCRCRSELHDTIGIADCATHATYLGGDRYSPWPVVQSTCWYLDWDVDSNELMKQKLDGDMEIGGEVRSRKREKAVSMLIFGVSLVISSNVLCVCSRSE